MVLLLTAKQLSRLSRPVSRSHLFLFVTKHTYWDLIVLSIIKGIWPYQASRKDTCQGEDCTGTRRPIAVRFLSSMDNCLQEKMWNETAALLDLGILYKFRHSISYETVWVEFSSLSCKPRTSSINTTNFQWLCCLVLVLQNNCTCSILWVTSWLMVSSWLESVKAATWLYVLESEKLTGMYKSKANAEYCCTLTCTHLKTLNLCNDCSKSRAQRSWRHQAQTPSQNL